MGIELILAGGPGWPDISSPESLLPFVPNTLIVLWPASSTADPNGPSGRCGERFRRPTVQRVQLGETACRRVALVLVLCAGGRLERQLDHLVCAFYAPAEPGVTSQRMCYGELWRPTKGVAPSIFQEPMEGIMNA